MFPLSAWRFDPIIVGTAVVSLVVYLAATARYRALRSRAWPRSRSISFAFAIAVGVAAIESPLDAAADVRFTPHMVQHLILTDITAPMMLLGAPLLLLLGVAPTRLSRQIVRVLKSPVARWLTAPLFAWLLFILILWLVHYTGFFEAALVYAPVHILEHGLFLSTALLFWFPVIAIGPTPWATGPLAYPLRMLYLVVAMPAEGMLGFTLNGARHILYSNYARAGLADQQMAGEIMWIGGTFAMFVAFMLVGNEWAQSERRLGERLNDRAVALVDPVR